MQYKPGRADKSINSDSSLNFDFDRFYEQEATFKRYNPHADRRLLKRVNLINGFLPRRKINSALDVGCGDGYLCGELASRKGVHKVVGSDLSNTRVAVARKAFPNIEFRQATIYKLPFPENSFDLVVASEVLEHLEKPVEAFAELVRVSAKFIIITVPHDEQIWPVACPHCMKRFPMDGHIQRFDSQRLRSLCQGNVKVARVDTSYMTRFNPVFKKFAKPVAKRIFSNFFSSGGYLGLLAIKRPLR